MAVLFIRRALIFGAGAGCALGVVRPGIAASPRITIELRNTNGSVLTTLRLYKDDKTWIDINNDASPLNAVHGTVDDQAYNQLHCLDDAGNEVVRLANCNWDITQGFHNAGFCYGCKTGFEKQPSWYCTGVINV
ncbi:hypothetical protein EFQ99_33825 [Rhizobium vallis]|uniref:Uncharacterized protein n=2 Tax=Rhizobium TaxID=379 RepID=A0A2A6J1I8_9HYPH|nr:MULTISPECIES: hypothetical protein [Rhizobium]PDS27751.1 hypothetical protein CO650_30030 [Rhizobium phaseoli]PDT00178.1 hypothetical protein CO666_32030 [Rhizobium chutanense]RUM17782.1 hypothetical protein EFQ99_33825 [Rhizobium vallis]